MQLIARAGADVVHVGPIVVPNGLRPFSGLPLLIGIFQRSGAAAEHIAGLCLDRAIEIIGCAGLVEQILRPQEAVIDDRAAGADVFSNLLDGNGIFAWIIRFYVDVIDAIIVGKAAHDALCLSDQLALQRLHADDAGLTAVRAVEPLCRDTVRPGDVKYRVPRQIEAFLCLQDHRLVARISVVRPVYLAVNDTAFVLGDGNRAVGRGGRGDQVALLHRQRDLGNGNIGLRHHPVAHQERIGSAAQNQRLAVLIKLNGDRQLLHLRLVAIAIHRDNLKQEIVIVAAGGDGIIRTVERVLDLLSVACVPHRLRQGVPVEPERLVRTERVQRSAAVAARHVHLVRHIGRRTVDLHLDQTEGVGADVGIGRAAVGREGDALIVVKILG